jgi:uncharacterized membrane protein
MTKSPNRLFGIILGIAFLTFGLLGFFLTSDTGFIATSGPKVFLVFEVNPLLDVIQLGLGVALLIAALAGARAAKLMNLTVGVLLALLGLFGLLVAAGDNPLNVLALNGADVVLHFAGAAVLLAVGYGADREAAAISAA